MRRRIWVDQIHSTVTLSRFGFSVLLTGLANERWETLKEVSLVLKQGNLELKPKFISLRTKLLSPKLASRALGRFADNLDKGFVISATFDYHEGLQSGLAQVQAIVLWTDNVEQLLRIATLSLQLVFPCQDRK